MYQLSRKLCFFLLSVLLLSSCAAVKPYYADGYKQWDSEPSIDDAGAPVYTFYLIGDAGKPDLKEQEPTLKLLEMHLSGAPGNSSVIFLGDNIYTYGMPAADNENRPLSEARINESLKILENYDGRVFFVPGNHDWYAKDVQPYALYEEEKYIEEYLDNDEVFIPAGGSPGPEAISLSDDVVLIAIDSYRWIRDLDKVKGSKTGTPKEGLEEFTNSLTELLLANSNKNVIIADHHPYYTNGGHGGYYSWKDHLFPLRVINKKLYIPLPVLGSILPFMRKIGLSKEDKTNKYYKRFVNTMLATTAGFNNVVYASGHEHSLQLHQHHQQHFIVSGSGTKSSYLRKGHKMAFGHMSKGFTKLYIYEDGSMWVEYLEPIETGNDEYQVFRWQLNGPTK